MNAMNTLKLAGAVLTIVASMNAWSQNESTSTDSGTTATQAPSKSSVRKANRALSKKVLQALTKGGVDSSGVHVLAKGSAVTLTGSVPEAAQIDKAGEIAKQIAGVTSVKNDLTVNEGKQ
jgi:osmotically-inducible protein OsmY